MKKYILLLSILISYAVMARETRNIDRNWEFVLSEAVIDGLADVEGWRTVDVPHDWSIEGEFERSNPTGQGGAYLPAGTGWYRKTIKADFGTDERLFLEFDGVMACSSVYVDGKLAGYRPNGYVGFTYDITDLVTPGKDAVIAVKVDNSVQPASRWYTGSGINRHVRLVSKNACHIPMDGAFVSYNEGKVEIKTTVANTSKSSTKVSLRYILKDADGKTQITDKSSVAVKALGHKWDSGVVTKEATYTAEGIRTFTCLNDSSHTKTEPIPKKERQSSGSSDGDSSSPVARGAWDQDTSGWHYRENGTLVSNAWRFLSYNGRNSWYYFGENGIMQTGWLDWKENRYYLYPVSDGWMGRMLTGWQLIDGKWYYFETTAGSTQGRMYRAERTPDGYYAGADGAWDGNPANAGR